jgi:hypothetical protein
MDADGIDAAFLYPSLGLFAGAVEDPGLAAAMCRAYNRWLAVGHTDDVRRRTITEIIVGGNPHAVSRPDLGPVGGNDAGCDPLPARHAGGDEAPIAARGAKQIMHRVDDRGVTSG